MVSGINSNNRKKKKRQKHSISILVVSLPRMIFRLDKAGKKDRDVKRK